jgi:predicted DNA-binding transcriptional regulator YafY
MVTEQICGAIAARAVISFAYSGRQRIVEPHALGHDKKGSLILSAWQTTGGSGEGWRDFICDKMSGLVPTGAKFAGPRPGYNPNDSTLTRIVCRL